MLERLVVKNVALIDESEIEFSEGLNILTGETGAGKSILIDSINLALGAKADKNLIRQGAEYAYVELCFSVHSPKIQKELKEMEIFPDEDGKVILQRRIMPGKSTCRINGESVSGKMLKDAAAVLIDIHGQHEHQSLLSEKKHLDVLDTYCGAELSELSDQISEVYIKYKETEKEYEQALLDDRAKDREISLAQFEVKEIEEASLQEGEDAELEEAFRRMEHVKSIGESVSLAFQCLGSYEQENAETLIGRASKSVSDAMAYDSKLQTAADQLLQAEEMVRDAARFLQHYMDDLEIDGEAYAYTRERLNTINHLKNKYGNTLEEIFSYAREKTEFLNKFEDFEQYKEKLAAQKDAYYETLCSLCQKAHAVRAEKAFVLQKQMQDALLELNFPYAKFEIEVTEDEKYLSKTGDDHVRFMISLNAGEVLKPLAQVASGGELSRIMLALKTVLADQDEIESLIFDEIDAGISGKTAWKVSEKLGVLGRHHQVICITHLPQIAAMADHHFMIEKHQTQERTTTTLTALNREGMLSELARLLGGDVITDTVLQNAKELKEMAIHTKQY
nr:DNA repair protein RecN [Lachnospiraceae bacterium]